MPKDVNNLSSTSSSRDSVSEKNELDKNLNDLEQIIYQIWTKFLLCAVDVKQRKEDSKSRPTLILHNLIARVRKQQSNFLKTTVVEVLQGNQSLVDFALIDDTTRVLFNRRHHLPPSSKSSRHMSLFHSLSQRISFFAGDGHQKLGNCPGVTRYVKDRDAHVLYPFMRIQVRKQQDSKGITKCVPTWSEGCSFITELLRNLRQESECIFEAQQFIYTTLKMLNTSTDQPSMHDDTYGPSLEKFMTSSPLVKALDATSRFPITSFKEVLITWKPEFFELFIDDFTQQPKLSIKMGMMREEFQAGLKQLVSTNCMSCY